MNKNNKLPSCMMPDGAEPCEGYQDLNKDLDKAIKLLTKCSTASFMNNGDPALEKSIDDFLNECSGGTDCELNCEECKNCPTSLKPQAD